MILLDTDILIDVQRGHPPALTWNSSLQELPSVPGFVVMELIQGARNSAELRDVEKLTGALPVIWPSVTDCERALMDFSTFHLSHALGLLDSLIAAYAVGLSAELCTFNSKHYQMVSGLLTIQPYKR